MEYGGNSRGISQIFINLKHILYDIIFLFEIKNKLLLIFITRS